MKRSASTSLWADGAHRHTQLRQALALVRSCSSSRRVERTAYTAFFIDVPKGSYRPPPRTTAGKLCILLHQEVLKERAQLIDPSRAFQFVLRLHAESMCMLSVRFAIRLVAFRWVATQDAFRAISRAWRHALAARGAPQSLSWQPHITIRV